MSPPRQRRDSLRAGGDERQGDPRARIDLIGLDLSDGRRPLDARRWWPILIVGILLALGVASLRVDLIRMRYALADALSEESQLLEEQRSLTVAMRRLRDPGQLAARARELGFIPPAQVLSLPDPPAEPAHPRTPVDGRTSTALAALGALRP